METPRGDSVAFLLAQLGGFAAARFAARLDELDLTPPVAGLLRLLARSGGLSQRELAARLGAAPSRVVAFVDELERRGWVRRQRDTADRRVNLLVISEQGESALSEIGRLAREHDREVTGVLSEDERARLGELLGKLAAAHELEPGVHPGYRGPA